MKLIENHLINKKNLKINNKKKLKTNNKNYKKTIQQLINKYT